MDKGRYVFFGSMMSFFIDGGLFPVDLIKTRLQVQGGVREDLYLEPCTLLCRMLFFTYMWHTLSYIPCRRRPSRIPLITAPGMLQRRSLLWKVACAHALSFFCLTVSLSLGSRGFYKGFAAQCAGAIPTQLLYFGSYEYSRYKLQTWYECAGSGEGEHVHAGQRAAPLSSASLADSFHSFCSLHGLTQMS